MHPPRALDDHVEELEDDPDLAAVLGEADRAAAKEGGRKRSQKATEADDGKRRRTTSSAVATSPQAAFAAAAAAAAAAVAADCASDLGNPRGSRGFKANEITRELDGGYCFIDEDVRNAQPHKAGRQVHCCVCRNVLHLKLPTKVRAAYCCLIALLMSVCNLSLPFSHPVSCGYCI